MKKGTYGKAALYAIPLFLSPFADKIGPILTGDKWPSSQMVAFCTLIGTIATCIVILAYFDGSAERDKQEQNEKNTDQSTAGN